MFKNTFYILLFSLICWGSYQISYPSNTKEDLYYDGIFLENIIKHVETLTKKPRSIGDTYHDDVERYLKRELSQMGLNVSVQTSVNYNSKYHRGAPVRNIIATYPGTRPNNKALLLMAHYDAAKFSATGAGDDASGVAVILESINSLLKTPKAPSNDLVVLFSDGEEIGLLGARAFINEQLSYYDIGLIINLEARGTGGPVMMWPETFGGNRNMIELFKDAKVPMPVTTSLHYEIYRLLSNDTDLSPFNQQAQLNGFNLAFIDDHFNYHTSRDSLEHLSLNTLAHQSIQLNSLLKHFADTDLSQLKTEASLVYFSIPLIGIISYPTQFNWVILATIFLAWSMLLLVAKKRGLIGWISVLTSPFQVIVVAVLTFSWCWLVVNFLYFLFPEFIDILQGFPYSGHQIMAAVLISAGLLATIGFTRQPPEKRLEKSFANILLWLFLLAFACYLMPGSGLLIWPIVFSLLVLVIQIFQPKHADSAAAIMSILSFIAVGIVLVNFPIALGIKAIPITAVVLTALLALFLPLYQKSTPKLAVLLVVLPLLYLTAYFIQNPTISVNHPHPTSLSYLYDHDSNQGYFYNYDEVSSGWNEQLFKNKSKPEAIDSFRKKYRKPLKNLQQVEKAYVIEPIDIKIKHLLSSIEQPQFEITLTAHSNTEIIEIYSEQDLQIQQMDIENRTATPGEPLDIHAGGRLLQYHLDGKKQIKLKLSLEAGQKVDWQIQSHSIDLLSKAELGITSRPPHQIPKPFIPSDNIITVQSLTFDSD